MSAMHSSPFIWDFSYKGFYGIWFHSRGALHAYKHTILSGTIHQPKERIPLGEWIFNPKHLTHCNTKILFKNAMPVRGLKYVILLSIPGVKWKKGEKNRYSKFCPICYKIREEEWKQNGMYDRLLAHEIKKFKREYKRDPFTGIPEV